MSCTVRTTGWKPVLLHRAIPRTNLCPGLRHHQRSTVRGANMASPLPAFRRACGYAVRNAGWIFLWRGQQPRPGLGRGGRIRPASRAGGGPRSQKRQARNPAGPLSHGECRGHSWRRKFSPHVRCGRSRLVSRPPARRSGGERGFRERSFGKRDRGAGTRSLATEKTSAPRVVSRGAFCRCSSTSNCWSAWDPSQQ